MLTKSYRLIYEHARGGYEKISITRIDSLLGFLCFSSIALSEVFRRSDGSGESGEQEDLGRLLFLYVTVLQTAGPAVLRKSKVQEILRGQFHSFPRNMGGARRG